LSMPQVRLRLSGRSGPRTSPGAARCRELVLEPKSAPYRFSDAGVTGELYPAVYDAGTERESWAERSWLSRGYLKEHPGAVLPPLPTSVVCFNGLVVGSARGSRADGGAPATRCAFGWTIGERCQIWA
jgi:hypothetical protein